MPAHAPARSIHEALRRGDDLLQVARECVLTWEGRQVKAREGKVSLEINAEIGGMQEVSTCRFYIAKTALRSAPAIDTLLTIQGRTGQGSVWRVQKLEGGHAAGDTQWILACVEEHS